MHNPTTGATQHRLAFEESAVAQGTEPLLGGCETLLAFRGHGAVLAPPGSSFNPRRKMPSRAGRYNSRMDQLPLKAFIRDIPDFPVPGVLFRDITPLLANGDAFAAVLAAMEAAVKQADAEAIVAVESRGFLFGAPLAHQLGLPLVPVRKHGKLPASRESVEYALEYGANCLEMHTDALAAGTRAVIVDDLLATGGTALAAATLVERVGGTVAGFAFAVELAPLGGRAGLAAYPVWSVLQYE